MNNQNQWLPDSHAKLYKDVENKKISGVCAGLADYFSINVTVVRIVAVLALFTFTIATLACYIGAEIFLKPKPANLYASEQDEEYWRQYRRSPRDTLAQARNRFMRLETRLRKLESYVTSKKFSLDQEFEDMSRNRV